MISIVAGRHFLMRRKRLLGLALCSLIAACSQVMSASLSSPLVLLEAETGFAGKKTTTIAIEPDGHFCFARKLGSKSSKGAQHGRIDQAHLDMLAKIVANLDVGSLPDSYGVSVPVNGYQLTFVVDGRPSVFHLPAPNSNGKLSSSDDASSEVGRAVAIRRAMMDATEGAPSEPSEEPCEAY